MRLNGYRLWAHVKEIAFGSGSDLSLITGMKGAKAVR